MPGGQCKQGRAGEDAGPSTDAAFSAEPDRTPLGLFGQLPADVFRAILDQDPGMCSKLFRCSKELAKLVCHHSALRLKLDVRDRQSPGAWVGVRSVLQWLPALALELKGPEERYNPHTYTCEPVPDAQALCEQALCGLLGITPDQPSGIPGLCFPGVRDMSCYKLHLPTLVPAALAAACPTTSTVALHWVTLTTSVSTSSSPAPLRTARHRNNRSLGGLRDGTWSSVVSLRCSRLKLESRSSPTPRHLKTMLPSLSRLDFSYTHSSDGQVLANACLSAWAHQLTHLTVDAQVFAGKSVAASLKSCQGLQLLYIHGGLNNDDTIAVRRALHSIARPFVVKCAVYGMSKDAMQALLTAPQCTEVVLECFRAADDISDTQCISRSITVSTSCFSLGSAARLPTHSLDKPLLWRPGQVNGRVPPEAVLYMYDYEADKIPNASTLESVSSTIQRIRKLATRGGVAVELDTSTVLMYEVDRAAAGQILLELLQAARACVHLRGPVPRVDVTGIGGDLSTAMLAELAAIHEPTGGIRQLALRVCTASTPDNLPSLFALLPGLNTLILYPARCYYGEQQHEGIADWARVVASTARVWLAVCEAQGSAPRLPLCLGAVDWMSWLAGAQTVWDALAREDLPQDVQLTVCNALWADTPVLCVVIAKQEGAGGAAARVLRGDDLGELV